MSQFRCHACDIQLTSLTSQKNGNLDTCAKCAIEQAPFLFYTLKRRDQVIIEEIICQKHYAQASQPGRDMAPLSVGELSAGMKQTVTPYTAGNRPCATCEEEAERQKGTAA